jgi:hypothetical protein
MRFRRTLIATVSLTTVLALTLVLTGAATAKVHTLTATLTGAAERPGPGDPDGSGTATIMLSPGTGEICWSWQVTGVDPIAAAHIHEAPVTDPGPVVVPTPPDPGDPDSGDGCATVDRHQIAEILSHPEDYYFNVHNAAFPAGALRGQLSG